MSPKFKSFFEVTGPIAAIDILDKARTSLFFVNRRSKKNFTPFTLVKMIQSYAGRLSIAISKGSQSSGGTIFIVGHSRHSAPRSERSLISSLACARARVTTIFFPMRGRFSNHFIVFLNFTTSPKTIMAGAFRPIFSTRSTIVSSVPTTVI